MIALVSFLLDFSTLAGYCRPFLLEPSFEFYTTGISAFISPFYFFDVCFRPK